MAGQSVTPAALHQRAIRQCDHGRYDLAHRTLLTALAGLDGIDTSMGATTDTPAALRTRAQVLITLSYVEGELRGGGHGLGRLQEAERVVNGLRADDLTFAVRNAHGLWAMRNGSISAAIDHFTRAETLLAAANHKDAAILLLNRGSLHLSQLDLDLARADLSRCADVTRSAPADVSTSAELATVAFMAQHNRGYLEYLAGNLPEALRLMDDAAAHSGQVALGVSRLDRARVLIEAGLSDAAGNQLEQASEDFRRGRQGQELAETELTRAECAILSGDLKTARKMASSARARFKRRGNHRWRRMAELALIQADFADGRPPARLMVPATRLASEFAAQGLKQQARTARLVSCEALVATGHPDEAAALFETLRVVPPSDPIVVKVHHRVVAAAIAQARGDHRTASSQVRTGLNELTRHQAQFGSIDLQTAGAIHGRRLVELDHQIAIASGRSEAVFNAIERGRAVSTRLTPVTPATDQSGPLLTELRQLTEVIRSSAGDPAAAGQVHATRSRIQKLYEQLNAISWRVQGDGAATRPATLAQTKAVVSRGNKVLVALAESPAGLIGVRVDHTGARLMTFATGADLSDQLHRIQADLNVLAYQSLPQELRVVADAALRRSLARLDDALITPLGLVDQQPLVIIPTAGLATLPWNCLPTLRGRPVEVAPTAALWLTGTNCIDRSSAELAVQSFAGPGLISAQQETAAVAAIWRSHGARASSHNPPATTRQAVSRALSRATLVHIAAHGQHQHQNPLFSSLQLADGSLFAYEIGAAQLAPHIVLSACELGQDTVRPGDEALGLTRVLLQLGAGCVVAGVAPVKDETAGLVMADYHRRLAEGIDSATALAAATEMSDDPFVPFTCFGSSWKISV